MDTKTILQPMFDSENEKLATLQQQSNGIQREINDLNSDFQKRIADFDSQLNGLNSDITDTQTNIANMLSLAPDLVVTPTP